MISVIVSPLFLINNIARYLMAIPMPPVPEGAAVPSLTNQDRERIAPHLEKFFARLNEDDADFQEVAEEFADRIGVTPGQIALMIHELANSSEE